MRYYIDCKFDGHHGDILSMAIVRESCFQKNNNIYIIVYNNPINSWVLNNVMPVIHKHQAEETMHVRERELGPAILSFLADDPHPTIIADSPVDIGRFCRAISTGPDRQWASVDFPRITFEVHNVDCYPTDLEDAVQHNAWWDAMALRHRLESSQPRLTRFGETIEQAHNRMIDAAEANMVYDDSEQPRGLTSFVEHGQPGNTNTTDKKHEPTGDRYHTKFAPPPE